MWSFKNQDYRLHRSWSETSHELLLTSGWSPTPSWHSWWQQCCKSPSAGLPDRSVSSNQYRQPTDFPLLLLPGTKCFFYPTPFLLRSPAWPHHLLGSLIGPRGSLLSILPCRVCASVTAVRLSVVIRWAASVPSQLCHPLGALGRVSLHLSEAQFLHL